MQEHVIYEKLRFVNEFGFGRYVLCHVVLESQNVDIHGLSVHGL